jgi:AhpD family alkylhydroperoxidase
MSPSPDAFRKRVFDPPLFRRSVADVSAHMADIRGAAHDPAIGSSFGQRIWLAVTEVNGCRYCSYMHTRAALRAGVPADEVRALAGGTMDEAPDRELAALAYGQHHAETRGQPDAGARSALDQAYGADTARRIEGLIRWIMVANLTGNTFDALLSRLRGRGAEDSSLLGELGALLAWAWAGPWLGLRFVLARPR